MIILVINCGSSSIKYQLLDMKNDDVFDVIAKGIAEKIGLPAGILGSIAVWKTFGNEIDLGYLFPWKAILLSSIAVFLIVGLTMRHSIRKIKEQNIVETIRTDTI